MRSRPVGLRATSQRRGPRARRCDDVRGPVHGALGAGLELARRCARQALDAARVQQITTAPKTSAAIARTASGRSKRGVRAGPRLTLGGAMKMRTNVRTPANAAAAIVRSTSAVSSGSPASKAALAIAATPKNPAAGGIAASPSVPIANAAAAQRIDAMSPP